MEARTKERKKTESQFSDNLNFKQKTEVRILGADIENINPIRTRKYFWFIIPKMMGHKKFNVCVKQDLHNWVLNNPPVVKSPIENDFLKFSMYGLHLKTPFI